MASIGIMWIVWRSNHCVFLASAWPAAPAPCGCHSQPVGVYSSSAISSWVSLCWCVQEIAYQIIMTEFQNFTSDERTKNVVTRLTAVATKLIPDVELSYQLLIKRNCYNAFADSSNPKCLKFGITQELQQRISFITDNFEASIVQKFKQRKPLGWRAVLLSQINKPGECKEDHYVMFDMAMSFILGHELGHLRQSHHKIKNCLGIGVNHNSVCISTEIDADISDDEDVILASFVIELAADYDAIKFSAHTFTKSDANGCEISIRNLWIFMVSVALIFFILEDHSNKCSKSRPAFGFVGSHPAPPSRLLWTANMIAIVFDEYISKDRASDYLVDAIGFATYFWHSSLEKNDHTHVIQEIHPSLQINELENYEKWRSKMILISNDPPQTRVGVTGVRWKASDTAGA
ncbi:MAG: M48 family metalloprotease [Leptothrix sp. (in: b-proteobacteria)]